MPTLPESVRQAISRIRAFIHERTRSTEDGSDYDGFLSYSAEWHALIVGALFAALYAITGRVEVVAFFALVVTGKAKVSNDHLRDAAKELAYSGGGFLIVLAVGAVVF